MEQERRVVSLEGVSAFVVVSPGSMPAHELEVGQLQRQTYGSNSSEESYTFNHYTNSKFPVT